MRQFFIKKKLIDEDLVKISLDVRDNKSYKGMVERNDKKISTKERQNYESVTLPHVPQDAKELKGELKVKFGEGIVNQGVLSPRKIWGQLVLNLRHEALMTLYAACGEQRDMKLIGNTIIVTVHDEFSYNLLKKPENYQKIDLELKKINDKIKVEFNLETRGKSKMERNLAALKKLFGDEIDIK